MRPRAPDRDDAEPLGGGANAKSAVAPLGLVRLIRQAYPERGLLIAATILLLLGSAFNLATPALVGAIIDIISGGAGGSGTVSQQWIRRLLEAFGVEASRSAALRATILMFICTIAISTALACVRGYLFGIAGERVVMRARRQLFERVLAMEVGFFDDTRTGELINRLSTDTTILKDVLSSNISSGLQQVTSIVGGISYLFFISWKLTLVMLAVVPVVILGARFYGERFRALSKSTQSALAEATEVAEESISNIRTVRSFARERYEASRYEAKLQQTYDLGVQMALYASIFVAFFGLVGSASLIAVLWYGATLVLSGDLSSGTLTSFVLYTISVAGSIGGMAAIFADLMKAVGANARVFELLDRQPIVPPAYLPVALDSEPDDWVVKVASDSRYVGYAVAHDGDGDASTLPPIPASDALSSVNAATYAPIPVVSSEPSQLLNAIESGGSYGSVASTTASASTLSQPSTLIGISAASAAPPAPLTGHIELRNVMFSYPTRRDQPVLRGLDLDIKAGSVTALVGPSGAGKSTVVALVERFYDISDENDGKILFDGVDIRTLPLAWLRKQMALVSQEPVLFCCSIRDNIAYGLDPGSCTHADIEAAAIKANAHSFISAFPSGYDTMVGERGVRLSGGQKQRVAIARALLLNPRLLLLDEATSALDAESEHLVQQALEALMRDRTTIVIAHRLSTIRSADHVAVIDGGRVVESGTHASLLAHGESGLYATLVRRQLSSNSDEK